MIPNNTSTIRIGNGNLTYDSYGSGPPLVLVHPEWMNRAVWQPQLETLVAAHQVITYDLRGHGASTTGSLPYAHMDDLAKLLDWLELDEVVLVGQGLGGSIVRALAIEQPERVRALALLGATSTGVAGIPVTAAEIEAIGQPRELALASDWPGALDAYEAVWFDGVDHSMDDGTRAALQPILEQYAFAEFQPDAPEIMSPTHTIRDLHQLHMPLLLLWGLNDQPIIERTALATADAVAHAHTASMADSARFTTWEQSAAVNAELAAFLENLS